MFKSSVSRVPALLVKGLEATTIMGLQGSNGSDLVTINVTAAPNVTVGDDFYVDFFFLDQMILQEQTTPSIDCIWKKLKIIQVSSQAQLSILC
jgi:hypothetical protein